MVPLKTRYDGDKLQILCVGKNDVHIWVSLFDLYDYFEDETIRLMDKKPKESLRKKGIKK